MPYFAYRVVHGSTQGLPDVEAFLRLLQSPRSQEVSSLFDPLREIVVTRAPGRLDVMGGIADYSGSLVLEMPIQQAALVALQRDATRTLRIVSLGNPQNGRSTATFEMPLDDFEQAGRPLDYESGQAYFRRVPDQHWAAYVAGVFLVLMRERGTSFREGVRILLDSRVPEGKGVSSSAAIEVAVIQAVSAAFAIALPPRELALLCQKVENQVAGAPCGVMDQMTASCGEQGQLLALLCQPASLQGMVSVPKEITFWGVDSGVRHSVAGSDYGSVRVGAFMGYRILAEMAGLRAKQEAPGLVSIEDPRWHGYLANLSPDEFDQYSPRIPEQMTGGDFLARFGGTTDSATHIETERAYAIRQPAAHAVYENLRVRAFAELLTTPADERQLSQLGELMFQSHASYSACGLGSPGTDRLVDLVRAAGPASGLFGAKITGGGSGGTVAVLGRHDAVGTVESLVTTYSQQTGRQSIIFSGSSPGANSFGWLRLAP